MLIQSKFSIILLIGVSTLLFSGCFTTFTTLQSSPTTRTVYVMEEFEGDKSTIVYVYDQWYDYVPIHRPQWTPYVYYGNPMVDVCIQWPSWYWSVRYDPWWDVHYSSYYPTYAWHPNRWGGYHPHTWHPTHDYYSSSYAWYHHDSWNNHHPKPAPQYPKNYDRRSFDQREPVRRTNSRSTQVVSRNSTSRTPTIRRDNNSRSGSRIKKPTQTSRSVWVDRNNSLSKQQRTGPNVRAPEVRKNSIVNPTVDRRKNGSRSSANVVQKQTPKSSRISALRKDKVTRTPNVSSSSVSKQNNRSTQVSMSSNRSTSRSHSTTIKRNVKPKSSQPSVQSRSTKQSSTSLRKSTVSQPKPKVSSGRSSRSTSSSRSSSPSIKRSSSNSKRSGSTVQKTQSSLKSNNRSSSSNKKSNSSSRSIQRKRR